MSESSPYCFEDRFDGGVFHKDAPGGRQTATLEVGPQRILARTADGTEYEVPWRGVRFERGSGGVVLVHGADRRTTVFCDHADFMRAVEAAGGNDVNDALSRFHGERVSSQARHLLGCLAVLLAIAAVFWGVPRLFRGAVNGVVSALPFSVDEAIGEAVVEAMDPGGREVEDEELRAAIQVMIDRLAPHVALDEVEFNFRIVENETINAFALPGGYITIFTGLLRDAERPEQVAGVLAHEMAHVTGRHGLRRVAHSLGVMAGLSLLVGDTQGLMGIAVQLFTLATVNDYSQDQETEADLEGVRTMVAANIDPTGLAEFFDLLEERYGDVPDALAWTSTHPQHAERIAAIRAATPAGARYEPLDLDWEAVQALLAE